MKEQVVGDHVDQGLDAFETHLRTICSGHAPELTRATIERRNRGAGSGVFATYVIGREKDSSDTPEEDAADLATKVIARIRLDAARPRGRSTPNAGKVAGWEGAVLLYNDKKSGKAALLDTLPCEIEDPDAFHTYEHEGVKLLAAARDLVVGMSGATVKLHDANARGAKELAKRDKQFRKAMRAVGKVAKSGGRWRYKEKKEKYRSEATQHKWSAKQARTRQMWEAVETVGTDYKDVAMVWSEYFTKNRKPGDPMPPPPKPPTDDEVKKVFADREEFERRYTVDGEECSVRTVVAEMIAEADPKRRGKLARKLLQVLNKMPKSDQQLLKMAMVVNLGEARAREVAAWLSIPV